MPSVEMKVFEGEFSPQQTQEMMQTLTDVLVSFKGEHLRQATWTGKPSSSLTGGKR